MYQLIFTQMVDYAPLPNIFGNHPIVNLRLIARDGREFDFTGLISSSSPWSVFHSTIADVLGIDWKNGRLTEVYPFRFEGFLHRVNIQIEPMHEAVECDVIFTDNIYEWVSIIGRDGIFNSLLFGFQDRQQTIYLALDN